MFGRTRNHLDEIIEFIRNIDPDVVGLVEVDNGSYRSGRQSQTEQMAKELGHFHSYCSKYGKSSCWQHLPIYNNQGNSFLAKDTIHSEKFHYFKRGMKKLVIELELKDVTIFLVHLALGFKARQSQILHLYDLVKDVNRPYILAGDFNAFMGEKEIQLLMSASGMQNADPKVQPSYPSWNPKRHLDFILHSPEVKIKKFWIPQVQLSDHLPLVVDFEIVNTTD
jgi:endonuclease/exonuclease/phosphatase family metal-dependent hydrolase